MDARLVADFVREAESTDDSPVRAALAIARIAYPSLDADRWVDRLDELGETARRHLEIGVGGRPPRATRLRIVAEYVFGQLGFAGDREHYDDPRNSYLNDVIARRSGIPITLAVVFIEIARRANVRLEGVNFPGHFLVRCPPDPGEPEGEPIVLDPFHGGVPLDEDDCLRLLRTHAGAHAHAGAEMLQTAGKRATLLRMLLNLKRALVRQRSFQQARDVTDLLIAMDPSALTELRDRGLLASQLQDYSGALRDLEDWLRLSGVTGEERHGDVKEVWDHVKSLRQRLASMN
jgi:regulator of sirC expression with transglutaminase-like and TPR domain